MAPVLSLAQLESSIMSATGLRFSGREAGPGSFVFRPAAVEVGRGFTLKIEVYLNSVIAICSPEGYASRLVQEMRRGYEVDRTLFEDLIARRTAQGWTVLVRGLPEDLMPPEIQVKSGPRPGADMESLAESAACLGIALVFALLPEESANDQPPEGFEEGATTEVLLSARERDPRNRALCLALQGFACASLRN